MARLDQDFKPLVEILMQKYKEDAKKASKKPCLPKTMEQVEKEYNLIFPENTHSRRWKFNEPSTLSDIQACTINALITSSLCTANDKRAWAYHLYKVSREFY